MMNEVWKITLGELDKHMGVEVLEESAERVVARMPVAGNRQSLGLLHGGAMAALAESVGSWAALIHASTMGKVAVGVDINATHHSSGREGFVTATATAIRLGRTLTSHEVVVVDDAGKRLCTARITNAIVEKRG
ncbi:MULTISPECIES: PaaI family thioesterase [unclassified Corynebacterium]|uniref:PaaI family thioesterase n=1 Tax=unclassified Corynebacterium TaxID=2624378 RepID=UPI000BAA8ECB|nr:MULTISPECIES: PaaI family thioesterase [unclassified Corynebacterium]PAT14867.1 thioesterase [Corynebacterium sp. NML 120412]